MSFLFRHIARSQRLEGVGTAFTLGGVPLPAPPEALGWPRTDGRGRVVGQGAATSWLCTGTRWQPLNTNGHVPYGPWSSAFDAAGQVYWQQIVEAGMCQPSDGSGSATPVTPWHAQALGILDIDPVPARGIVMDDGQPRTFTRRDGSTLRIYKCVERAGVCVGQADEGTTQGVGIVAYFEATDLLYRVYRGDISWPVSLDDDGMTVAISGDLANGFITSDQWTPEPPAVPVPVPPPVPVPVPPPVPVPVPPPTFTVAPLGEALVGCWYPYDEKNEGTWLAPGNSGIVDGFLVARDGTSLGVVIDLEYNRQQGITLAQALAQTATATRRFVYDAYPFDETARLALGTGDVALVNAYPNAGEDPAVFQQRAGTELTRFATIPHAIVCRAYNFDDPTLVSYAPAYDWLARLTASVGLIFFAYQRADGLVARPQMLLQVGAFADAASELPDLPTRPVTPPVPERQPSTAAIVRHRR